LKGVNPVTKIKAIVSILLVLSLMFGIAACGKDKGGDETTVEETTAEETAGETSANDETSAAETSEPASGDETSAAPSETQAQTEAPSQNPGNNSKFPVGTDKAAIVEFYNKAANAVKAYKGTLKVTRKSGAYTKIEKFDVPLVGGSVRKLAEDKLPNDWDKAQPKTLTFNNGVAKDGDKDRTLAEVLPPEKAEYMSKLTPAGVKSAECKLEGSNAKITITLVEESSTSLDFVPPHHSSCLDTLKLSSADLDPFTIKNAKVTYKGATITAVINEAGQLLSLQVREPAYVEGNVGYSALTFPAAISGGYNADYTFVW